MPENRSRRAWLPIFLLALLAGGLFHPLLESLWQVSSETFVSLGILCVSALASASLGYVIYPKARDRNRLTPWIAIGVAFVALTIVGWTGLSWLATHNLSSAISTWALKEFLIFTLTLFPIMYGLQKGLALLAASSPQKLTTLPVLILVLIATASGFGIASSFDSDTQPSPFSFEDGSGEPTDQIKNQLRRMVFIPALLGSNSKIALENRFPLRSEFESESTKALVQFFMYGDTVPAKANSAVTFTTAPWKLSQAPLLQSINKEDCPDCGSNWLWLPLQYLDTKSFSQITARMCQAFDGHVDLVWESADTKQPLLALVGQFKASTNLKPVKLPETMDSVLDNLGLNDPANVTARVFPRTSGQPAAICKDVDEPSVSSVYAIQMNILLNLPERIKHGVDPELLDYLFEFGENDPENHKEAAAFAAFYRGRFAESKGLRKQAIDHYLNAAKQDTQWKHPQDTLINLAEEAVQRKEYIEAKAIYQGLLNAGITSAPIAKGLAILVYWDRDFKQAAALYAQAHELDPNDAEVLQYLGLSLFNAGKEEDGIDRLLQASKLNFRNGAKNLEQIARKMEADGRECDADMIRIRLKEATGYSFTEP